MLRIRLGVDDLARIRLASEGVAATIEAVYSSVALRRRDGPLLFGDWARHLRPRLGPQTAPLLDLFHSPAQVPLFLIKRTDDPAVLAEHVLSVPAARLRELVPTGPFARRLATGDRDARRQLATAITAYHRAFAGALPAMQALVHADLTHRRTLLAGAGLAALLDSLHPVLRWRSPFLEIESTVDREVDLAGRALQLTPSVFLRDRPGLLVEQGQAFITYPVRGTHQLGTTAGDPLADLLGRTRAAALRALRTPRTTTELAAHLDVSLASASEHAAVLRRANLVVTYRDGRAVRHELTALGHGTLAGDVLP